MVKEGQFTINEMRKKTLSELYKKSKIPVDDRRIIGDQEIENIIHNKFQIDKSTDQPIEKYEDNPLLESYRNIVDMLKEYCDLNPDYYPLIACWIIGSYAHKDFISYPYLFFNAMRGSGKTRILKLIAALSKDGEMLNSLTEAVLFRTQGTLCIDEFEGIAKKGNENLRELLNSAYKRGTKVKRMKKKKTHEGEGQVVEEFEVYRPIVIANIWGMESVLADRCLTLIIEKSNNKKITKLMEIFENSKITTLIRKTLNTTFFKLEKPKEEDSSVVCVVCSFSQNILKVYEEWNDFIKRNYTNYTYYTHNTNYTNYTLFKKLIDLDIDGRHLELALPLIIIAQMIDESLVDDILKTFKKIIKDKKEEDYTDNLDILLIDYISQLLPGEWKAVNSITKNFKESIQNNDDWVNTKWLGRALKRLNLVKQKKRQHNGVYVIADVDKAQQKIRMFK